MKMHESRQRPGQNCCKLLKVLWFSLAIFPFLIASAQTNEHSKSGSYIFKVIGNTEIEGYASSPSIAQSDTHLYLWDWQTIRVYEKETLVYLGQVSQHYGQDIRWLNINGDLMVLVTHSCVPGGCWQELEVISLAESPLGTYLSAHALNGALIAKLAGDNIIYGLRQQTNLPNQFFVLDIAQNSFDFGPDIPAASTFVTAAEIAYVVANDMDRLLDLSGPIPEIIGTVFIEEGMSGQVVLYNGLAYRTTHDRLAVIDLSEPSSPAIEQMIVLPTPAWAIAVEEKEADLYLIAGRGLLLYDLSELDHPAGSGSWHSTHQLTGLAADGRFVYVVERKDYFDNRLMMLEKVPVAARIFLPIIQREPITSGQ
jgi:hypothetical protein